MEEACIEPNIIEKLINIITASIPLFVVFFAFLILLYFWRRGRDLIGVSR